MNEKISSRLSRLSRASENYDSPECTRPLTMYQSRSLELSETEYCVSGKIQRSQSDSASFRSCRYSEPVFLYDVIQEESEIVSEDIALQQESKL